MKPNQPARGADIQPVMAQLVSRCRWLNCSRRLNWPLKCCFTSIETVGLLGTGAQDVHLDFHTAPELCFDWPTFTSLLYSAVLCSRPTSKSSVCLLEQRIEELRARGTQTKFLSLKRGGSLA